MSRGRIVVSINGCWDFLNFRAGLMRALAGAGYELVAVAPPDECSERLAGLGCRYVPIAMNSHGTSVLDDLRLLAAYRRILRRERPAAFLGYTLKPNVYGSIAAHSLRIPVINNIGGLGTAFLAPGMLNRLVRPLYRIALRRSRTVFFQNRDDMRRFAASGLVREEQALLLPGSGVDLELFAPTPPRVRGDGFTFLLATRLLRSKGVGQFVEAARRIRAEAPSARFMLAGIVDQAHPDGMSRGEIEAWREDGAIDYLGTLADVRPHLADADCVVLPSFYPEGTPRILIEAAAMEKPLIAADMPGCRDLVDEGVNGFLVAPRDTGSLVAAMRRMMALTPPELAQFGRHSREKAVRDYDERIVIAHYLAALDRLG